MTKTNVLDSDTEQTLYLADAISIWATPQAYHDKLEFKQYKEGIVENKETYFEMCILDLLSRLGLPIGQMGTTILKEMIIKIVDYLNTAKDLDDGEIIKRLTNAIEQPYSQFYLDIARGIFGIGITTCHQHIMEAFDAQDLTKADTTLLKMVFGKYRGTLDYGEVALILGEYLAFGGETNYSQELPKINFGKLPKGPKLEYKYGTQSA